MTERKTTMASASLLGEKTAATHSQTLSRGIRMLEILSEEISALSIGEVAERMGVHRSVAYRIKGKCHENESRKQPLFAGTPPPDFKRR